MGEFVNRDLDGWVLSSWCFSKFNLTRGVESWTVSARKTHRITVNAYGVSTAGYCLLFTCLHIALKPKLNWIFKHSVRTAKKTTLHHYKDQPVKAVQGSTSCLCWKSRKTHTYTVTVIHSYELFNEVAFSCHWALKGSVRMLKCLLLWGG
jgi:hypothetical protein